MPDSKPGCLKIFLGYAAGVGKTEVMLTAARQQAARGRRVLVSEKEAAGLETAPFDLDLWLARKPELALVGSLAHSNPAGSRHMKRYQDVEELLEAGIDVYATLNIGHLESLKDAIAQITGAGVPPSESGGVEETVPDGVLERADSLVVVDLPPEERPQDHLHPGNLAALREMTLRRAADRVDVDVRTSMRERSISGPWSVRDRLLVSVGPSPLSERLVRAARRLADSLNAEWMAVTVEGAEPLEPAARERISMHLRLAESLGATTARISGVTVAETVIAYARQQNVTKIVAGKPLHSTWRRWLERDLVDRLIKLSGNIDIYVISGASPDPPAPTQPRRLDWNRYLMGSLAVVLTTAACMPFKNWLAPTNLVMAYLVAVTAVAYRLGRGPSVLASTLAVALLDFFFVPPYYTFAVTESEYIVTFIALQVVSLVISDLTARAREQAAAACKREEQTVALLDLSRELSFASDEREICQALARHISRHLKLEAGAWLNTPRDLEEQALSPARQAVASWVAEHSRPAGNGTDTLPESDFLCHPMISASGGEVLGLLGVPAGPYLTEENRRLLEAFCRQSALAMERSRLARRAHEAELVKATEALQTALLNSISHDLRIPLVSITGALTALQEDDHSPEKRDLLENAVSEADRLNRIVGNLLQITRLESGVVKLNRQPHEVHDLVVTTLHDWRNSRKIELDIPQDLPLVNVDYVLIQLVLTNLLDNAHKFSPAGLPIEIGAHSVDSQNVEVWVTDHGPGIVEADRGAVFERFYRIQHGNHGDGSGLGLSICKGLVEAHQGRIWVEPLEAGNPGASFHFLLQATHA